VENPQYLTKAKYIAIDKTKFDMDLLIDNQKVKQGTIIKGFLSAGSAPSHEILIPYVIINGMEPGQTLCVVAGIHPPEYSSIEAVIRLINQVKVEQIKLESHTRDAFRDRPFKLDPFNP